MPDDCPKFDTEMDWPVGSRMDMVKEMIARASGDDFIRGEWSAQPDIGSDVEPWLASFHPHIESDPAKAALWAETTCQHHRGVIVYARTPFGRQVEMFRRAAFSGASSMFVSNEPFNCWARGDVAEFESVLVRMNDAAQAAEAEGA
jgi:hypothetical protein